MQEPDRETIYVGALLACGLPPKPRHYTTGYKPRTIVDYSKAHRDWVLLAEHIVYTGLWDWMRREPTDIFKTQQRWAEEKQQFLNWIAVQQVKEKYSGERSS